MSVDGAEPLGVRHDVGERGHLLLPIEHVGRRRDLLIPALFGVLLPDHVELIGVGERKWPQHTAFTAEKIAVFAPTPRASVRIAALASTGVRRIVRSV